MGGKREKTNPRKNFNEEKDNTRLGRLSVTISRVARFKRWKFNGYAKLSFFCLVSFIILGIGEDCENCQVEESNRT